MFLDPNSQSLVKNALGQYVTQQDIVGGWADQAGFGGGWLQFESYLPDDEDLDDPSDTWYKNAAQNVLQNQQVQMRNMGKAINQSFFNKVVKQSDQLMAGVGMLEKFRPEIANMAAGKISGLNLDIGGTMDQGIGAVQVAKQISASPNALSAVASTMNAAVGGLSAIMVVNPIITAVASIGFAISKAFTARQERARAQRKAKAEKFYKGLKPSATFDKSGDQLAMNKVLQAMPKSDWTGLFLPRYNPTQEWIGVMRRTGFEFFPGDDSEGVVQGVADYNSYNGVECLGMIPGTQQISGALQSNLTAAQLSQAVNYLPKNGADQLWEWAMLQAPHTVGQGAVDVGDFYPSSAQAMSFLWGNIQTQGAAGNPDLYKLNCPEISEQWRQYCLGAWDYLQDKCSWDHYSFDMGKTWKGESASMAWLIDKDKHLNDRLRAMEAQHACVIACLLGVYRCNAPELGGGLMPAGQFKQGPGSRACNTGFNSFPSQCRQSIYDAYIKDRVNDLFKMQFDMLSASLVCAYVRSDFAAFNTIGTFDAGQSIALRQKLDAMRDKLLDRPDQWKHLVEANVPRDEKHREDNWYDLLKDAGAFEGNMGLKGSTVPSGSSANYGQGGMGLLAGAGFNDPAPPVMQLVGRIPGQELVEESRGSGGGGNKGALLIAAAAFGLLAMSRKRR